MKIGDILFDERSGNYFKLESDFLELQNGYLCTDVKIDDYGNIIEESATSYLRTKKEVEGAQV